MENFAQNITNMPILVLAFVGDSVFDLYVRSHLALNALGKVNILHKKAVSLVNASAQAKLLSSIKDKLTPEELAIYNRGKNAKSVAAPHVNPKDYSIATGLEALLGVLYLKGENDRINELFAAIINDKL